jgi:4-amino-4-deoxy-L-arabinose transferase-like glycosyltransferase
MRFDFARPRRLIAGAALIGLCLRLLFGLVYWVDKPMTHDEREYLSLARSVAAGRGFVYDAAHETGTAQQFGRAPAYPLFLAMIGAGADVHDGSPVRVKIAQSIVGAVGVWLVGLIALRAAGPRAGVLAAAVAAVYPPLVWICAYVLSEALYSTLALAAVLLLDMAMDHADDAGTARAGGALALIAGLLIGIAVLTRPAILFFLPLAAGWLMARRRAVLAVAFLAAVIAVVAPWTARNVRAYGKVVLVASEGGVTFWTGNHPLAKGEGDLAANPDIKRAEVAFRAAHPGLTSEQLEPLYYREAIGHILDKPGWWLGLLARKAFYTVVPLGPSYTLHSKKYFAASLASYLLLLPFAAAGLRVVLRSRRRPTALLLLAASSVLVCLVFFPQERFRIPVIDPTLIVCAAAAASRRFQAA